VDPAQNPEAQTAKLCKKYFKIVFYNLRSFFNNLELYIDKCSVLKKNKEAKKRMFLKFFVLHFSKKYSEI